MNSQTIVFPDPPFISAWAAVVGKKEGEGPLGRWFDAVCPDDTLGCSSWEKAETTFQQQAVELALKKAELEKPDLEISFAGDLLNQCVGSGFAARNSTVPFAGLYGACSTMALSTVMAAVFVASGFRQNALASTSSHFSSAERQFRFPLSYGGQRTPTSQWTVTGAGALVVARQGKVKIKSATVGRIVDYGVRDINNMGAAMAPAAADTIMNFLADTKTAPSDYDLILTGDLGYIGSELLIEMLQKEGIDISKPHNDCGRMIFNREKQDVHAGGSGCGCSAAVLCGYILPLMAKGELKNVLFCATGALMSPTTDQQGESIPAVAHLIHLSAE